MSAAARGLKGRCAIAAILAVVIAGLGAGAGCGRLDVGSDLLWTATFEGGTFDEWTGDGAGSAQAFPMPPNMIEVSGDRVHHGAHAAKLTVEGPSDGTQGNAGLARTGGLPEQAYYSAWYYLPRSVTISTYWVIFKFRQQDQSTSDELFDLDLLSLSSGEMSLHLYDHRQGSDIPLDVSNPILPVGRWFQVEAFYRNAQDATGHLTFWLDGQPIVDFSGPMARTSWVEWVASSIVENVDPSTVVIYVDDCAISRSRVGPHGLLEQ